METFLEKLLRRHGPLREPVVALPQLTEFFHKMDMPEANREMYHDVFAGKGFLLGEMEAGVHLKLYDTAVALLDERAGATLPIAYLYLFERGTFHGKEVCLERFLWKDEGEWAAQRIDGLRTAQYVFFHLVDHFNAVVSDQEHTNAGARWWQDTARKSLERHLDVFAANANVLRHITDLGKFVAVLWGKERKYADRQVVVAKKNFFSEV